MSMRRNDDSPEKRKRRKKMRALTFCAYKNKGHTVWKVVYCFFL